LVAGSIEAFAGNGVIQYNRDIRPILSDNCFACHGPDEKTRAAELRLDVREAAVNKQAIVPGKPAESSILKRILSSDENEVMPPPTSHKTLTQGQKDLLRAWIAEGAEYQGHWAYIVPVKPELPQVRNPGWVRNPIDRFVLSELERRGIEPAPEADLRSLIRRVALDLTGLPPSPEDVERVLSDPTPERYENYVDELLSRQEWGEHRGRYWLDYARYADTHGIHFDNYREVHLTSLRSSSSRGICSLKPAWIRKLPVDSIGATSQPTRVARFLRSIRFSIPAIVSRRPAWFGWA
jgi:hypothetical protein